MVTSKGRFDYCRWVTNGHRQKEEKIGKELGKTVCGQKRILKQGIFPNDHERGQNNSFDINSTDSSKLYSKVRLKEGNAQAKNTILLGHMSINCARAKFTTGVARD